MTEPREGIQHKMARIQTEFYLMTARGRAIHHNNYFQYNSLFIESNKLQKRFQGHSYDIVTQEEIIEIDDLNSHPKKSHRINDGIAEKFIRENYPAYKFYRLLKEEIVDQRGRLLDPKDVADYLRENLF